MAGITQCRSVLKKELFPRSESVGRYLPEENLAEAAESEGYRRDRIWTPAQTVWTFLPQVLHAGWACRTAVAETLAQQAAAGTPLEASPDRLLPGTKTTAATVISTRPSKGRQHVAQGSRRWLSLVGESGWWTGPVAQCRIRPNCRRPSASRTGKSRAGGTTKADPRRQALPRREALAMVPAGA